MERKGIQTVIDKMRETETALAHSQAVAGIGEAVLALQAKQVELSTPALLAELLARAHGPGVRRMDREKFEEAARRLGWTGAPSDA